MNIYSFYLPLFEEKKTSDKDEFTSCQFWLIVFCFYVSKGFVEKLRASLDFNRIHFTFSNWHQMAVGRQFNRQTTISSSNLFPIVVHITYSMIHRNIFPERYEEE